MKKKLKFSQKFRFPSIELMCPTWIRAPSRLTEGKDRKTFSRKIFAIQLLWFQKRRRFWRILPRLIESNSSRIYRFILLILFYFTIFTIDTNRLSKSSIIVIGNVEVVLKLFHAHTER